MTRQAWAEPPRSHSPALREQDLTDFDYVFRGAEGHP